MKFCSNCGESVVIKIPAGDTRERAVCDTCDIVHYQNPRIVAGVLPTWGDQVLLCRRAIEPRRGYWTLPAGFLENGETAAEGAARETMEEANARLQALTLYSVFSLPHLSQVYMFYRAELADLDFSSGEESLEVALFNEPDIPWEELAFPTITQTLQQFFTDRKSATFTVFDTDLHYKRR